MSIYVVTGGAGFIGSHLATHIGHAGYEVRVLDNLTGTGAQKRAAALAAVPYVTLTEGDVRDPDICARICAGADIVLHHAAEASPACSIQDPVFCADVNVRGTLTLLQAARDAGTVKRFVYASSCAVYGDTPAASKHEAGLVEPITPYASAHLAGEYFCRNFYRLYGLQTVTLRYFNVYGPGQEPEADYANVISRFLSAIVRGEKPQIYGDGEQSRDFIYVSDIVEANLRAVGAQRGVGGKVFNIGSGQRVSLNQLIEKLEWMLKITIPRDKRQPRIGDITHSRADIAAAAGLLQFAPTVSLENGLAQTLHWIQAKFDQCSKE